MAHRVGRWQRLAVALGLVVAACTGVAQGAGTARTAPAAQIAHAADVEQAEQRFVAALSGDVQALAPLLADDFIYLTTAGTVIGKAALLAHLGSGATVVRRAERQQVQHVQREGVVVSTGLLLVQVEHGGGLMSIRSRFLHVWAPSPQGWQLVTRQATDLRPQDSPSPRPSQGAVPSDAELRAAFLYAYPYHEFMWLRDQALSNEQSPTFTRLNTFRHQRHLATPADRWANGPINDTFYSTAWLDLAAGPVLLSLPDTADRYYVLVLIGADTNSFEYLGRRSTGTAARQVAVVGPDWTGPLPAADQLVRAPTRDVYLNLRVLVRDPADLARAHAVQDGFSIVQRSVAPPDGPRVKPRNDDVERLFAVINEALARNPPPAGEAPLIERFRPLGLCGAACRWADLPPELQARWRALVPAMVARLKTALDASRRDLHRVNGWLPFRLPRSFAANHALRAGSAANSGGIFGLEAAEATYFMGVADADDEPLGQGRRYRLRLPAGGLPADAFWSVSLYEFVEGGQYLVANPINRYSIGDRTPGLVRNADGSLDLWIQPEAPADAAQRANWLPSPKSNRFYMNGRIYQPRAEVLNPAWALPAVSRMQP